MRHSHWLLQRVLAVPPGFTLTRTFFGSAFLSYEDLRSHKTPRLNNSNNTLSCVIVGD